MGEENMYSYEELNRLVGDLMDEVSRIYTENQLLKNELAIIKERIA